MPNLNEPFLRCPLYWDGIERRHPGASITLGMTDLPKGVVPIARRASDYIRCPQCNADLSAHYAALLKARELDAAVNPEADPVELTAPVSLHAIAYHQRPETGDDWINLERTPAVPTSNRDEATIHARMYAPVLRRE